MTNRCVGSCGMPIPLEGKWVCPDCGIELQPYGDREMDRLHAEEAEKSGRDVYGLPLETIPPTYEEYIKSPEWAVRRRETLTRAGYRCQACDFGETLEAHHRTYDRLGEESPDDLIALCSPCHTAVHLVADARRGVIRPESKRARWAG